MLVNVEKLDSLGISAEEYEMFLNYEYLGTLNDKGEILKNEQKVAQLLTMYPSITSDGRRMTKMSFADINGRIVYGGSYYEYPPELYEEIHNRKTVYARIIFDTKIIGDGFKWLQISNTTILGDEDSQAIAEVFAKRYEGGEAAWDRLVHKDYGEYSVIMQKLLNDPSFKKILFNKSMNVFGNAKLGFLPKVIEDVVNIIEIAGGDNEYVNLCKASAVVAMITYFGSVPKTFFLTENLLHLMVTSTENVIKYLKQAYKDVPETLLKEIIAEVRRIVDSLAEIQSNQTVESVSSKIAYSAIRLIKSSMRYNNLYEASVRDSLVSDNGSQLLIR